MRAGMLRHRVLIQQPIETQNNYGEPEVVWSNLATGVRASILPLSGREFFAARQFTSEIEFKIGMRYRNDVTAKMRIVDMDSTTDHYYIDTPLNVGMRNKELKLMCTMVVP